MMPTDWVIWVELPNTTEMEPTDLYDDKLVYIVDNLESIPNHPELIVQSGEALELVQICIRTTLDVVGMLVEELGGESKDDLSNIIHLMEGCLLPRELGRDLIGCLGVNMLLGQRFDAFDQRAVLNNIERVRETIYRFMDLVDDVLAQMEGRALSPDP